MKQFKSYDFQKYLMDHLVAMAVGLNLLLLPGMLVI